MLLRGFTIPHKIEALVPVGSFLSKMKFPEIEWLDGFSLQILDLEEHVAGLKIIHVAGTKGKVISILIFLLTNLPDSDHNPLHEI